MTGVFVHGGLRDAVARLGGEIYDEPTLARPVAGDVLDGQIAEQFFQSQVALREQARVLVTKTASGASGVILAGELAALSKTCITCHEAFLNDAADSLKDFDGGLASEVH